MKRDRQESSDIIDGNRILRSSYGPIPVDVTMKTTWNPSKTALIKINHEVECPIDMSDLWDDKWSAGGKEMSKIDDKIIKCPVCSNEYHKALYDYYFIHCNKGCKNYFFKDSGILIGEKLVPLEQSVVKLQNIISEKDKEIEELREKLSWYKSDKETLDKMLDKEQLKQSKIKVDKELMNWINHLSDNMIDYKINRDNINKLKSIFQPKEKKYEKVKIKSNSCTGYVWYINKKCPKDKDYQCADSCECFHGLTKNKKYVKCLYKEDDK